jgi:subtilisin family serine protease
VLSGALLAAALLGAAASPAGRGRGKLAATLAGALEAAAAGERHVAWVYLQDKGDASRAARAASAPASPRALSRRARRGSATAAALLDLPVAPAYAAAVEARVLRVRHSLRWLNALSVEATAAQLRVLEALPFVTRLDSVRRLRRPPEALLEWDEAAARAQLQRAPRAAAIDYGTSLGQLAQIGVPALHDGGLSGEGVVIAVLDAGFNNLGHEALAPLRILAARDFVNGDDDVGDGPDAGRGGSHGTATLSALAGFAPGKLVGPAFGASFILAKTENADSETPIEEDHWAAAAEWAEALGADVISSSLGYLEFDRGHPSYTPEDMNGETAVSTRAAELAAARGVVVVSSAGNAGFHPSRNTLGAPADGKRVVAAAALTAEGARASFSSVGPSADGRVKPDLAAQGQGVKVAGDAAPDAYRSANGTSFSCPLIAGVAALVLHAHPEYGVDQVLAVLRGTASQAQRPDNLLGFGIVDAAAAVRAAAP